MSDELLTLKQVAEILDVSWQTVRNYINEKKINAIKLNENSGYRITTKDLMSFLNKRYIKNSFNDSEIGLNSRNCYLMYDNKKTVSEILNTEYNINISELEVNNNMKFLNSIFWGDNFYIMKFLIKSFKGKVDLIYIDPPFGTNEEFFLYNSKVGYEDKIINQEYLEFLRERLVLLREFLSEEGSIYIHIDKKMGHYVKIILDEIFGVDNFLNDITRIKCNPKNFTRKAYGNYTDNIYFYAKNKDKNIFNNKTIPLSEEELIKAFEKIDTDGRRYTTHPLHAPGITKDGVTGSEWRGMLPPVGRHWRYTPNVLEELYQNNLIEISSTGNPRKKVYANDHKGKKQQDLWVYKDKGIKYTSYPTEKNVEMLEYIIENSSNPGSIVMDAFAGSFKFLVAAAEKGRNVIGIDINDAAISVGKENFSNSNIDINLYKLDSVMSSNESYILNK